MQGSADSEYQYYIQVKQERRKAEENAKVIAKNITFLHQEESKTLKKIDDLRKEAEEALETRLCKLEIK